MSFTPQTPHREIETPPREIEEIAPQEAEQTAWDHVQRHRLVDVVPGGPETLWIGVYVVLTLGMLAAGLAAMLYAATGLPPTVGTISLLFVLTFGAFAVSPSLARAVVGRIRRRVPAAYR